MDFKQVDTLTASQIEDLVWLYQQEWWTKGRTLFDVQLMLQHCGIVIAFCEPETDRLVAFTRILTDYVYKALIFDVIADMEYRGQGLGKVLMDAVINHPRLENVQSLELYCAEEMIPFYLKWGFTELTEAKDGQRFYFMRKRQ